MKKYLMALKTENKKVTKTSNVNPDIIKQIIFSLNDVNERTKEKLKSKLIKNYNSSYVHPNVINLVISLCSLQKWCDANFVR